MSPVKVNMALYYSLWLEKKHDITNTLAYFNTVSCNWKLGLLSVTST